METRKAYERRLKLGYFQKYLKGKVLDIGGAIDPLSGPNVDLRIFDKEDGDACFLQGIESQSFDCVYSSHCLEHLVFPHVALQNWFEKVKPGGHLFIAVPHRDLYERRRLLPSLWNAEHCSFWLPEKDDPPHTYGLRPFVEKWLGVSPVMLEVCSEGWKSVPASQHAGGEYQIECAVRKPE